MKCNRCKNKRYCDITRRYDLSGCTSGVPSFAPEKIAMELALTVKTANKSIGIDTSEYFDIITRTAKDFISMDDDKFRNRRKELM